jgi:hypothetical protein
MSENAVESTNYVSSGDFLHARHLDETAPAHRGPVGELLTLLGLFLEWAAIPRRGEFPNVVGALACLTRAYRQLRATLVLCHFGYYSEVGLLLRGAYESAVTSRYLAKDSGAAERWLKDNTWFPDRQIRKWFAKDPESYAEFYRYLSSMAHPTAGSAMMLLNPTDDGVFPRTSSFIDQELIESAYKGVYLTAILVCFAARNSVVAEEVIPPWWRQRLAEIAKEAGPTHSWEHLARDWEQEQHRYRDLMERIRSADELPEEMSLNPLSWTNLQRD